MKKPLPKDIYDQSNFFLKIKNSKWVNGRSGHWSLIICEWWSGKVVNDGVVE